MSERRLTEQAARAPSTVGTAVTPLQDHDGPASLRVGRRPKLAVVAAALADARTVSAEDLAYDAGVAINTARKHADELVRRGLARRVQPPPRRRAAVLYAPQDARSE
jgi:predicted transcriptional regulator